MHGLFCLLIAIALGAVGSAFAQTYSPSYDCRVVTDSVEVFVCHDRELSALDREMSATYHSYIRPLPSGEAEQLKKGQIAWIQDRNTRCKAGHQLVDRACIESAYRGRKAALESLASLSFTPGAWEREGMRWVQLASRSSADEAVLIAQSLRQTVPQHQPYLVLLALNGWYAVVSGPHQEFGVNSVLNDIKNADPMLAAEGPYITKGYRYALRLYHSLDELPQSVERPTRIQSSTPAAQPTVTYGFSTPNRRCSSEEITKRQAVCYVALAGEMACQSFLEKQSDADVVLASATTAAMCSAASSGLQNGTINPEAVLGAAFRGAVSGIGTKLLHEDNDPITRIFGAFLKLSVVSYDVSQAIDCARAVEWQCRQ